jgi:sugar lactone lactonase YvrE
MRVDMRKGLRLVLYVIAVLAIGNAGDFARGATVESIAGNGRAKDASSLDADKPRLATEAAVGQPFGVEIGPGGALYITEVENHRIRRVDLKTGQMTTVAGNGKKGYSGDGGPAATASLNEPYEVRFDSLGNMYFVEMQNHLIRRVDAKTGVISTVAGTGQAGYAGDGDGVKPGNARRAQFRQPHSIALAGDRWMYVADIGNHRIRRIDLERGTIESIAGNGEQKLPEDGEVAKDRPMLGPRALAVDGDTLWIALREGHSIWSLDLKAGKLKHVAGSGKQGYRDAAAGEAKTATFNGPKGIAVGPDKRLYVVDTENQAIRRVDAKSGEVTTVAGTPPAGRGFGGDGGDALRAKFDRPHGIVVAGDGTIFIGDTNNHRVRAVK